MALTSLIVLLTLATAATGCSRPKDYEELPVAEVLAKSELTVVATMTGYDVVQQPNDMLDVKYNTNIFCVLRNTKSVPLQALINITSVQHKTVGNANTCELRYINNTRYNQEAIIMIRPYQGHPGEFLFDDVNFQGPFFYLDEAGAPQPPAGCDEAYNTGSLEPVSKASNSAAFLHLLLTSLCAIVSAFFLL